jgi:hypothetical protein
MPGITGEAKERSQRRIIQGLRTRPRRSAATGQALLFFFLTTLWLEVKIEVSKRKPHERRRKRMFQPIVHAFAHWAAHMGPHLAHMAWELYIEEKKRREAIQRLSPYYVSTEKAAEELSKTVTQVRKRRDWPISGPDALEIAEKEIIERLGLEKVEGPDGPYLVRRFTREQAFGDEATVLREHFKRLSGGAKVLASKETPTNHPSTWASSMRPPQFPRK